MVLLDTEPRYLRSLLQFLYTAHLPLLSISQAFGVLYLASKYIIKASTFIPLFSDSYLPVTQQFANFFLMRKYGLQFPTSTKPYVIFCVFLFWRARLFWPLHCFCRLFVIFFLRDVWIRTQRAAVASRRDQLSITGSSHPSPSIYAFTRRGKQWPL